MEKKLKNREISVDRLASRLVSPSANYYTQYFATGDSRGIIRLWDINQFQKSIIFQPSQMIRGPSNPN